MTDNPVKSMDDLVRSRRKSTIQKSERQKEIELERTSNSKKSKTSRKQVEEIETSLIEEADESAKRFDNLESRGAVGGEIIRSTVDCSEVIDEEGFEEDSDPLGAVKSPTRRDPGRRDSLVVLFKKSHQEPDNWSIQNQFFPPNCVFSPPFNVTPTYQ